MKIHWTRCHSYEEAKNYEGVIYLHEWDEKPFYWGIAKNSYFGGGMRKLGDQRVGGRYNVGYRHWIEGCLRHGAKLYVGKPEPEDGTVAIEDVEQYLIATFGHVMNTRVKTNVKRLEIYHIGAVPTSICAEINVQERRIAKVLTKIVTLEELAVLFRDHGYTAEFEEVYPEDRDMGLPRDANISISSTEGLPVVLWFDQFVPLQMRMRVIIADSSERDRLVKKVGTGVLMEIAMMKNQNAECFGTLSVEGLNITIEYRLPFDEGILNKTVVASAIHLAQQGKTIRDYILALK